MMKPVHDFRALSLDDPLPHILTLFRKRTWTGEDLTHTLFTITTDHQSSVKISTNEIGLCHLEVIRSGCYYVKNVDEWNIYFNYLLSHARNHFWTWKNWIRDKYRTLGKI